MGQQVGGWTDGWIDGWMERKVVNHSTFQEFLIMLSKSAEVCTIT